MIVNGNNTPLSRNLLTSGVSPGETITFIGPFSTANLLPPVVSGLVLDFTAARMSGAWNLASWTQPASLFDGAWNGGLKLSSCHNISVNGGIFRNTALSLRSGGNLSVSGTRHVASSALYVDQIDTFTIANNQVLEPRADGIFINASQHGTIACNTVYASTRTGTTHPDGIQLTNQLGPGFDCDDIDILNNIILGPLMQGQYSKEQHPSNIRMTGNFIRVGYKWGMGFWRGDNIIFTENDIGPFDPAVGGGSSIDFRLAVSPPIWIGRGNIVNGRPMQLSDFVFT